MKNNDAAANGLHWYHWVVLLSSLVLTFSAWSITNNQVKERVRQQFNFQSEQLLALIYERMSVYEEGLRSGVAMLRSHDNDVDVTEWRLFAQTLHMEKTYPGINGMGVIFYVPPEKLSGFLQSQRETRSDFTIKPDHDKNEYWPITYVEPVNANTEAVGLDMAFEENRFSAAKLSRDTGETKITKPIILVQDAQQTPGFLQFIPFYSRDNISTTDDRRRYFIGHVYAPFIMKKLIEGTLNQASRRLLFSVYDDNSQLYDELTPQTPGFDPSPLMTREETIDVYGRPWRFTIQTALSFRQEISTNQPLIILISGLTIDALLLWLFLVLAGTTKKATRLANDMTAKLTTSQTYFRHIISAAPSGICIINTEGIIEQVNPRMTELFGYSESELIGQRIERLLPQRFQTKKEEYRPTYLHNQIQKLLGKSNRIPCLTKSEVEFPAKVGVARFTSENEIKVVATVTDITDLVHVTDDLKRSNKELDEFAYVASHDLKAPLRGIIQLADWIYHDIYDIADDDTKENLSLLTNRAARLDRLLDDLLSYSRVGRKQGDVRSTDVEKLITNLMDLLDPQGDAELIIHKPLPTFETLAIPLETVFRNLLNNALKHNDKNVTVIEISCLEKQDTYEFSVTDNGPGILPKYHQQIFELFKTLKPRDEVEGSGMGLSIIKKIFDIYGLSIHVDSDGHSGTTFRFTWFKSVNDMRL